MINPADSQPPLEISVSDEYRELAVEYRIAHGWGDPSNDKDPATRIFNKYITTCFRDAVARLYWRRFVKCLREFGVKNSGNKRFTIESILGIERGSVSKLINFGEIPKNSELHAKKERISPSFEEFVLLLALTGIPVEKVGFPGGWQAVCHGIIQTLVRIRNEKLNPELECPLDSPGGQYWLSPVEFAWVYYLMLSEWPAARFAGPRAQELALGQLASKVGRYFPKERPISVATANRLLLLWSEPWFLFDSVNKDELLVKGFSFEEA